MTDRLPRRLILKYLAGMLGSSPLLIPPHAPLQLDPDNIPIDPSGEVTWNPNAYGGVNMAFLGSDELPLLTLDVDNAHTTLHRFAVAVGDEIYEAAFIRSASPPTTPYIAVSGSGEYTGERLYLVFDYTPETSPPAAGGNLTLTSNLANGGSFDPGLTLAAGAPTPDWMVTDPDTTETVYTTAGFAHTVSGTGTTTAVLRNTAAMAPYITLLDCNGDGLTALEGLTLLTALTILRCYSNSLTALDASTNVLLTSLACEGNSLTALDVSTNVLLTNLSCFSNSLTALDVSTNVLLTNLRCYGNSLTALDVSTNVLLTNLHCGSTSLTSLDVSTNTALANLQCDGNSLTSLDVSTNVLLTSLQCSSNSLTSLDVSTNVLLAALQCYSNSLDTVTGLENLAKATTLRLDGNGMSQPQVDTVLYQIYQITRTATNGTVDVGGSNAAPSGTLQAAASCPVDADTPGKEVAHELANDGCGAGINTWATVTITA